MTKTSNKSTIIKLVFGLALLFFVAWKISVSLSDNEFEALKVSENALSLIVVVILLMPVNWLIETIKWRLLIKGVCQQKFMKTLASVLAGVSTSLLTPNRIGNFIGRTVYLDKEVKTRAIIRTIHSNLAQFIASIVFGFVGLSLLDFEGAIIDISTVRYSAIFVLLVGLFVYFYPKIIDFNPLNKMYSEQMKKSLVGIQELSFALKSGVLLLSLLRYLVFLFQFYLLLKCFNAQPSIDVIIPAIAVVYLITTIIPSFLFGKLFVREASALFVLTEFGISSPIILSTVFILWMINLAVPSLIGAAILIKGK